MSINCPYLSPETYRHLQVLTWSFVLYWTYAATETVHIDIHIQIFTHRCKYVRTSIYLFLTVHLSLSLSLSLSIYLSISLNICTYACMYDPINLSLSLTHTHTHSLSLSLSLSFFLCIYLYIYSHPLTNCFVVSKHFRVARPAKYFNPRSKPDWLYVSRIYYLRANVIMWNVIMWK